MSDSMKTLTRDDRYWYAFNVTTLLVVATILLVAIVQLWQPEPTWLLAQAAKVSPAGTGAGAPAKTDGSGNPNGTSGSTTGTTGATGTTGETGATATTGSSATPGSAATTGSSGATGTTGSTGANATGGNASTGGSPGTAGGGNPQAPNTPKGPAGPTGPTPQTNVLSSTDDNAVATYNWLYSGSFPMGSGTHTILIVLLVGALGSTFVAFKTLVWHRGVSSYDASWASYYVLRPVEGGVVALGFYLVMKAGLSGQTSPTMTPYGPAAIAFLIGLFSREAVEKLRQIFVTVFAQAPMAATTTSSGAPAGTMSAAVGGNPPFTAAITPADMNLTQAGAANTAQLVVTASAAGQPIPTVAVTADTQKAITIGAGQVQAANSLVTSFPITVDATKLAAGSTTFDFEITEATHKVTVSLKVTK
jgi:hypothetical protein